MKNTFVLYTDFKEQIDMLTIEQRGQLLTAIMEHASGTEVSQELDITTQVVFSIIRNAIDRNTEKYAETCERRAEAGRMGGRPRTDDVKKANGFSEKAKKANGFSEKAKKANGFSEKAKKANGFSEKHNENDNEREHDSEHERDNEREHDSERDSERETEKPLAVSDDTARPTDVGRVVDAWNALGVNPVSKLGPGTNRYAMLKARIREYGVDKVLEAVERVRGSTFLCGGGDRGWTITLDWFVRPNNFVKVLEGGYDDRAAPDRRGSPGRSLADEWRDA